MANFSVDEMQKMQIELQEKYKGKWEPICAETGENKLLWMVGEIGEVIDIIKKNGAKKIISNTEVRNNLIEELSDVLMYFNDVLLCYSISPEDLKAVYTKKFNKNMERW